MMGPLSVPENFVYICLSIQQLLKILSNRDVGTTEAQLYATSPYNVPGMIFFPTYWISNLFADYKFKLC